MKDNNWRRISTLVLAIGLAFLLPCPGRAAQTQSFSTLHAFSGGGDGGSPEAGVTMDRAGNFYGTTSSGGTGHGTVFKLTHRNSQWILTPIYSFAGGDDGEDPEARVVFGPDGSLYGTTTSGGGAAGAGTVFNLKPPVTSCKTALCPWTETVLYRFTGQADGANPRYGDLAFDQAGNVYGTASAGGVGGNGVVFKLTRSGGSWTQSVLYSFTGNPDGATPYSGVILDQAGNLYGTTVFGGGKAGCGTFGCGAVYQLTASGAGWTETVLHAFKPDQSEGNFPYGGLAMDGSGNLYGTTCYGGTTFGGTVYELASTGGGWTFALLDDGLPFSGYLLAGPVGSLVLDSAGSLYGTTYGGGLYDAGTVFKLIHSGGDWIYSALYDFAGGNDPFYPYGNVVLDAQGNVYGTTKGGGAGHGIVFEITP